ncbi:MAG: hypothetical protein IPK60_18495 [Sandaracinaceae bacterium]|nr:hypothetical protein [Sandaracinaceae bacterium]
MRFVGAAALIYIGIKHFVAPEGFMMIMPPWMPAPLLLVQISGFFEIAGALGLLFDKTRRFAGYGLVALFIAVFPANIYSAIYNINPIGPGPNWVLWARLPFQFVFIAWALWVSRAPRTAGHRKPLGP